MHNCRALCREEILDVLCRAPYCRLAVAENNQPYLVPMYYYWKCEDGRVWFLLYSCPMGQKMTYMRSNAKVALEFETEDESALKTVVAKGRVIHFRAKGCASEPKLIGLEILAESISGRAYERLFEIGGCEA